MKISHRLNTLLLILLLLMLTQIMGVSTLHAMTTYYLDPDWTGTQNGTQAQPWNGVSVHWSAINTALASGDVTVYLSARDASTDTDDVLSENIQISNKTANPTGTLIIVGNRFYNTSDATPNWVAYTGASKGRVTGIIAQNGSHTKYSKVTIDGVHVVQTTGDKAISVCGDNWTVKNSEVEQGSGGLAPMFLIVPTADSAHEGSSAWCPASSNITIQNNKLHDSVGELIYVGAAGCSTVDTALSDTNCNGKPSHSNISILDNTIYNCGSWADQGDCIDMKAGLTNVTIRGNDISASRNSNNVRAIVTQGIQTDGTNQNYVIERNYIHDHPGIDDAAIALVNSWGTPNGITIRNNIIDTIVGGSAILTYDSQSLGVKIYNNTIYNADGFCITSQGGTYEIRNNACLSNNGGGTQTSMSGNVTSTNNASSSTFGGTCTSCVAGLTASAFTNVVGGDFRLPPGSVLTDAGMTLTQFAADYVGTLRPQGSAWDVGAYEFNVNSGDKVAPAVPTGLSVN